jgi:succinoglycan biosynthesis protein ExoA
MLESSDRSLLAPRADVAPRTFPFISVIVPVRNESAFIAATLSQLLAQDYPRDRFEILVADGGSTDDTPTIVRAWQPDHANLHLLDNPGRWSSSGRNVALHAARGELVVLVDGHCQIPDLNYLFNLADAFLLSGADCVGRPQPLDVTGATLLQRAIAAARSSRLGHHPASHIYSEREAFVPPQSVAIAYKREVFDRIGFFDETFDACEDVELNHRADRAGLRCFFTPRVEVRYHPRASLAGLFRQMVRYGRGRVRLLRKHPETFSVPGFVPAAFLAGLVIGPLAGLLYPLLMGVYVGIVALYLILVLLSSMVVSMRHRDVRLLPMLPLVFATVHLGAGAGVWLEVVDGWRVVRQRQRVIHAVEVERRGVRPPVAPRRAA